MDLKDCLILFAFYTGTWHQPFRKETANLENSSGLKPHETFEDICSDPPVADQLKHLYEHPDYVEMYPGMVSESAKVPMVPGVGIAPSFTISRAILSDAVALVRGDRFYTIDYNPKNLTNWGYSEVQYDLGVQQGW